MASPPGRSAGPCSLSDRRIGTHLFATRMNRRVTKKFGGAFGACPDVQREGRPRDPGRGSASDTLVRVDLDRQRLELRNGGELLRTYSVSTAANGPGELRDSGCTPRGRHIIRAKIGAGAPCGTVFVARRPTGELYTPALGATYPGRDWILTRILWLSGLEPGRNRLGQVDTMRRFIYMHGCPDDVDMSMPGSHGCVRMRNDDVIDLFNRVKVGTTVVIETREWEGVRAD